MKRFLISLALMTPFVFPACGSSSDGAPSSGDTGTGGTAGGGAGTGGSSAGTGGSAGKATAGSSGAAGSASPTGGSSGSGGSAGASVAGNGGSTSGASGQAGSAGTSAGTAGAAGGGTTGGQAGDSSVGGQAGDAGAGQAGTAGQAGSAGEGGGGSAGDAGTGGGGGGSGGAGGATTLPVLDTPPMLLSQAGLYTDIASDTVAPYAIYFEPNYKLWSDAATKRRWVYLPPGSQIDTSDMDVWDFPIGTRVWKEFTSAGTRVETRLITRIADDAQMNHQFLLVAYAWRQDQSDADLVGTLGQKNALGTGWDIPSQQECGDCHGHYAPTYLGLGAIQLSGQTAGLSLKQLGDGGMLTNPGQDTYPLPFDEVTNAGIGYLHGNCGGCHNETPDAVNSLMMRVLVGVKTVEETEVYKSAVNVPSSFTVPAMGIDTRIVPGDSAHSAIPYRISQRGNVAQMPPVDSKVVDMTGLAAVKAWIDSLPSAGGSGGSGGAGGAAGASGQAGAGG